MSARDRRVLMIGAAIIALVLGVGRGMPLLSRHTDAARRNAVDLERELRRARRDIADSGGVVRELARAREAWFSYEAAAIVAPSTSPAAGTLGAIASSAAEDVGLRVSSLSVQLDTIHATVHTVSARLQGSGNAEAVARFLSTIEAGAPALFVPSLALTQSDFGMGGPRGSSLAIDVTIRGYHLAPARGTQ